MKIFSRSAPILHLIREGEERAKDMRLLALLGWGNGTNFSDFWKSTRIIVLEPG